MHDDRVVRNGAVKAQASKGHARNDRVLDDPWAGAIARCQAWLSSSLLALAVVGFVLSYAVAHAAREAAPWIARADWAWTDIPAAIPALDQTWARIAGLPDRVSERLGWRGEPADELVTASIGPDIPVRAFEESDPARITVHPLPRARPSLGVGVSGGRGPTRDCRYPCIGFVPPLAGELGYLADRTLRRGDFVMTAQGVRMFVGAGRFPYRAEDFRDVRSATGLPGELRRHLTALDALAARDASAAAHVRHVPYLVQSAEPALRAPPRQTTVVIKSGLREAQTRRRQVRFP